jgi:hypothetical protein
MSRCSQARPPCGPCSSYGVPTTFPDSVALSARLILLLTSQSSQSCQAVCLHDQLQSWQLHTPAPLTCQCASNRLDSALLMSSSVWLAPPPSWGESWPSDDRTPVCSISLPTPVGSRVSVRPPGPPTFCHRMRSGRVSALSGPDTQFWAGLQITFGQYRLGWAAAGHWTTQDTDKDLSCGDTRPTGTSKTLDRSNS